MHLSGNLFCVLPAGLDDDDGKMIRSNTAYVQLLELLFEGDYALVGCFHRPNEPDVFASLETYRDYIGFVKKRAIPMSAPWPRLDQVRSAEERTRSTWFDFIKMAKIKQF